MDAVRIVIHFDDATTNIAFRNRAKDMIKQDGSGNWSIVTSDGPSRGYYNGYLTRSRLSYNSDSYNTLLEELQDIQSSYPQANLTWKPVIIPLRENQQSFGGIPINIRREFIHILYTIKDSYLHDRIKSLSEITVCFRCQRIKAEGENHSDCTPACRHCLGKFDPSIEGKRPNGDSSSPPSICSRRGCINKNDSSLSCPRCPNPKIIHDAEDCPLLELTKRHVRIPPPPQRAASLSSNAPSSFSSSSSSSSSSSTSHSSNWSSRVGRNYQPPSQRVTATPHRDPVKLTSHDSPSRSTDDIVISPNFHKQVLDAIDRIMIKAVEPLMTLSAQITSMNATITQLQLQITQFISGKYSPMTTPSISSLPSNLPNSNKRLNRSNEKDDHDNWSDDESNQSVVIHPISSQPAAIPTNNSFSPLSPNPKSNITRRSSSLASPQPISRVSTPNTTSKKSRITSPPKSQSQPTIVSPFSKANPPTSLKEITDAFGNLTNLLRTSSSKFNDAQAMATNPDDVSDADE